MKILLDLSQGAPHSVTIRSTPRHLIATALFTANGMTLLTDMEFVLMQSAGALQAGKQDESETLDF